MLTAVGLTPGGISTVHICTQTIHRTTHLIWEECGPCPVSGSYTLAFALQLRKKQGRTSVRVAEVCQLARSIKAEWRKTRASCICLICCYLLTKVHSFTSKMFGYELSAQHSCVVLLGGTSSPQTSAVMWQKKLDLMGKLDSGSNPVGEGASGSSGSATELSSLLPPPAVPLLATFLATRREVPSGSFCGPPAIATDPTDSVDIWANVRTRQRRLKRTRRAHR